MKYWRINGQNGRGAVRVWLDALPLDADIDLRAKPHKKDRSLAQNNLLWMWLTIIAREYAQARDEAHDWFEPEVWKFQFQEKFLGYKSFKVPEGVRHKLIGTSELNTADFTAFLSDVEHYAGSVLNITLPHPEDVFYEAMGRKAA